MSIPSRIMVSVFCLLWGMIPALAALPSWASPARTMAAADLCAGDRCCCAEVGGCPCSIDRPTGPSEPERTPPAPRPNDEGRLALGVQAARTWPTPEPAPMGAASIGATRLASPTWRFVGGDALPALCIWRT